MMVKYCYFYSVDKTSVIIKCCKLLNQKMATKISKLQTYSSNKLQTEGIINVCLAFKCNNNLQCFNIENNDVGNEAADAIAEVLASNTTVKQLWIGSNKFSPTAITKILKPIEKFSSLEVLDLSYSDLSMDVASSMEKVKHNNKIK